MEQYYKENKSAIRVSIVMTYFERKLQILNTLESFIKHNYGDDIEVVIIDDGSRKEPLALEEANYPFNIKIIAINPEKKWYHNSCIPYNIGFSHCQGDIIIIQNAECFHLGNVVAYASQNLNDSNYLSFSCYSLNEIATAELSKDLDLENKRKEIALEDTIAKKDGDNGWYNHSVLKPVGYHFCAAITKKNLEKLGGFDETYAKGVGFDDNEFLYRVNEAFLRIRIIDDVPVLHQYHYADRTTSPARNRLIAKNRVLFSIYTLSAHRSKKTRILAALFFFILGESTNINTYLKVYEMVRKIFRRRLRKLNYVLGYIKVLFFRNIIEPFIKTVSCVEEIPVVINNRNRNEYLAILVNWLLAQGMKRIIIIDNNSTYPPLLRYYSVLESRGIEIIRLDFNGGAYSIWETDIYKEIWKDYYIYTDSDLVPIEECGIEGLRFLFDNLKKHKEIGKIGFGIKIDDLPNSFERKQYMIDCEIKYWQKKISDNLYDAKVDTTFAIYAPYQKGGPTLKAYRSGPPLLVRHLPWYVDSKNKTEEEVYYENHANGQSSLYRF